MRKRRFMPAIVPAVLLAVILSSASFPTAVFGAQEEIDVVESDVYNIEEDSLDEITEYISEFPAEDAAGTQTPNPVGQVSEDGLVEESSDESLNEEHPVPPPFDPTIESAHVEASMRSPSPYGIEKVKLTAYCDQPGYGVLQYTFYAIEPGGNPRQLLPESSSNSIFWVPEEVGLHVFFVKVRDPDDHNHTITSENLEFMIEPADVYLKDYINFGIAEPLICGQKLSDAVFVNAEFISGPNGKSVSGSLTFDEPDLVLPEGIHTVGWTFTPDSGKYRPASGTVNVTVDPANDPGDNPGDQPGDNPGDQPGDNPGDQPGDNPGNQPGNQPGGNPGDQPGDNPGDQPGGNSCEHPGFTIVGAADPTCTEPGATGQKICSLCKAVIEDSEEIPANGHSWDSGTVIDLPATGHPGTVEYHCTVEGCDGTKTGSVPALGSIKDAVITGIVTKTYNGEAQTQNPVVKVDGKTLKKNTDYTLSYSNNRNAGTAAVTITGIGSYAAKGSVTTRTFTIRKASVASSVVSGITSRTYSGNACTQKPTVRLNGKTLRLNTDYKLSYKNNVKAGTATMTVTGAGSYTGSISSTFKINPASIAKLKASGIKNKVWNGNNQTQSPTITLDGKKLINKTDYTLAFSNCKNVGTAKITIKGKGNYTGTVIKTFLINPKGTALTSLTDAKASFTAKWIKQASQTTGYQIQYTTDKGFSSGIKTVKVTSPSAISRKITGLKSKKTYYVRIRTYKTAGSRTYYSAWSASKSVKTR